ncbi:heterokaryon incompatibility protein-domain-containing protein [Xylariaceae sp. FL0255]|nr:heterokaryon incompatibility protein-domain-containing protein [Xylariaceae sp. FL0255]
MSLLRRGPRVSLGLDLALWDFRVEDPQDRRLDNVLEVQLGYDPASNVSGISSKITIHWGLVLALFATWVAFFSRGRACAASLGNRLKCRRRRESQLTAREYAAARISNHGQRFKYRPLSEARAEIRLVYILPGSGDDPVLVNMIHASLYNLPPYTALSYCWGQSQDADLIVINGSNCEIGPNLGSALRQIRKDRGKYADMAYWIDALCINQADSSETSSQVQRMTEIYGKAESVTVWLGPPTEETEMAFAKMRALESPLFNPQQVPEVMGWDVARLRKLEARRRAGVNDESAVTSWRAIADVLSNPYFTRVWVAQELTNPYNNRVRVIGGRQGQRFDLISTVAATMFFIKIDLKSQELSLPQHVREAMERVSKASDILNSLDTLQIVRYRLEPGWLIRYPRDLYQLLFPRAGARSRKSQWKNNVLPLLVNFSALDSTDPRDKVFAAFSVLSKYVPDLVIDYTLITKEVYQKVVYSAIQSMEDLSILDYCGSDSQDLPSWTPDWRMNQEIRRLSVYDEASGGKAIYSCSAHKSPVIDLNIAQGRLTARGVIVDKVKRCSQSVGPYTEECHSEWWSMAKYHEDSLNTSQSNAWETYKRTVVADSTKVQVWDPAGSTWSDRVQNTAISLYEALLAIGRPHSADQPLTTLLGYFQRAYSRGLVAYSYKRGGTALFSDHDLSASSTARLEGGGISPDNNMYLREVTTGRKFCMTQSGRMGLVPKEAQPGDDIAVLYGSYTPTLLRCLDIRIGHGPASSYKLLGGTYIDGLMDGVVIKMVEAGDLKVSDLNLY